MGGGGQYDLSNWDCVADLISFLEDQYEVINFYNHHRDNAFIISNLEHLPEILNFNWNLTFNFKNTIVYFYKTKILKSRPNFLNLMFTKEFKLKFDKEMNDNFSFDNLKNITSNSKEKWYKVKNLINDSTSNQCIDELQFIVNNVAKDECIDLVHALYVLNFENQNQDIINFNLNAINDKIKKLIERKIELSKTQLVNSIGLTITKNLKKYKELNNENNSKWTKFYRIVDKGQRLPSIKNLFRDYHEIINIISQILITSVEIIPIIIPLKKEILDYTIFDEASQIYLENGIAVFYRACINIVVGDEKQLAPTNHFLKNISEIEDENDELEVTNDCASHFDSLLSYADSKFKKIRLNYHYRSNSKELIEFSNHEFYDSKLIFADISKKNSLFQPIKVIETNGVWDGQVNELEADTVIEHLQEILKNKAQSEIVGIITFNKKQSDLINEKINELSQDIKTIIEIERERKESENKLFIKNLEEVQGDERDIIILAISFAKNLMDHLDVILAQLIKTVEKIVLMLP